MQSNHRITLPRVLFAVLPAAALLWLASCSTPVPASPSPTSPDSTSAPGGTIATPTPPVPALFTQPPPACTDNLVFVEDLTIPDGTEIPRNATIDKRWLVQNAGTCNWDERYRLRLVNGDALGAPAEQALYPARAGAQVTLRIIFSAPSETGEYVSAWQAVAPDGTPFGDPIFISIVVTP
jgi:hypothetical protein